jgi:hypothetical protein
MIYTEVSRIELPVVNLPTNVIKYTEKGYIDLEYTVNGSKVEI